MNNRQWKKACKKAAAEIQRRWPGEYEIVPAEGDESVYAPRGYQPPGKPRAGLNRNLWRVEKRYATPPRGLLGIWECSGYETVECDFKDALDALRQREYIEDTDWDEIIRQEEAKAHAPHP